MSWLVPARQLIVALLAAVAVASPGGITLWISTPSGSVVQDRVRDLTSQYGVVLLNPDQVPPMLAKAVVAVEDERFYSHHGIDTLGLGRAVLYDVTERCLCEGGSTITEQLVKDVYLSGRDEGYDKMVDIVLAFKVEGVINKQQIMADYLSEITSGYGRRGVTAAACAYFGARLDSLSVGQYALLAGVAQAPSIYDPTVNPDLAAKRRKHVLDAMVADKFITAAESASAQQEPVLVTPSGGPPPCTTG
jgi:membrane peptidoglycan carboxypeptidase